LINESPYYTAFFTLLPGVCDGIPEAR